MLSDGLSFINGFDCLIVTVVKFMFCLCINRHKRLELLREVRVKEDSCTICCDQPADVTLQPCEHR